MEFEVFAVYFYHSYSYLNFNRFSSLQYLVKIVKISIVIKNILDVMEQNECDVRNQHTKIL